MSIGQNANAKQGCGPHQTCKVCGRRDKFDFHVPDQVWEMVVPSPYINRVVCLSCFDDFARERGADYSRSVHTLYFAGDQAMFEFRGLWGLQVTDGNRR